MAQSAAKQIVPGVFSIPVGPVNTFFLEWESGCTLIDTGFPNSADKILAAVTGLGKQPSDIRHIVLTHAHPDHIGSVAALKRATGAETYIHPLDAPIAKTGGPFRPMQPAPGLQYRVMVKLFGPKPGTTVEPAPIDHELEDGDTLPFAGGLEAIHLPGHCAGQVALLWPHHGGVLFAADACMHLLGLSWTMVYENFEQGVRDLRKLAGLSFEAACFGHGKPILRGASAQFRSKWG